MTRADQLHRRIRLWVLVVMGGLGLSGLTAIPLGWELNTATRLLGLDDPSGPLARTGLGEWVLRVHAGVLDAAGRHPFLAYGTDWLAFGHWVIALAFVGAFRDPVRNRWLFDFGLMACALVLPYAFLFGHLRGIPVAWRLIDCSFGVGGAIPLWLARRDTNELAGLVDAPGAGRTV